MGLFEKIEQKRQEAQARREERGIGTLTGLAKLIRKRQVQALEAGEQEAPKKERIRAK